MNKVILMGRLTRDPEVRFSKEKSTAIARYTLAVERRYKKEGENNADFISCIAFGRQAEVAEQYFVQGMKLLIVGRIQTGSYTNREGIKVYTTDVVVEEQEFPESKAATANLGGEMIKLLGIVIVSVAVLYGIPAWILCSREERRLQRRRQYGK